MLSGLFTRLTIFSLLSVLSLTAGVIESSASDMASATNSALTVIPLFEENEPIQSSAVDVKTPVLNYVYDSACGKDDLIDKICSTCAQCVPAMFSALTIIFQSKSLFYTPKIKSRIEITQFPAIDPPRPLPRLI